MPSASIPAALATVGASSAAEAAGTAALAAGAYGPVAIGTSLLPSFATAASLASTVVGGLGAIQSARAASASAGYNAQVAANNAKIATQNANFAGAEGEQNVAASEAKTRAALAATLTNQGASGVDINSGSLVDVRESEAKLGMLNTLNIRSEAARQAYGFSTQSTNYSNQSALDKSQKASDEIGGYLNAGSTVLGGIGQASKYTDWLNQGGY